MAAPFDFSSLSWISNMDLFLALLGGSFIDKDKLHECIQEEYVGKIFSALNQFFYWNIKLQAVQEDSFVTLTCITSGGLVRPNVRSLHETVTQLVGKGKIIFINYPDNSNFVTFGMDSAEAAKAVRQGVAQVDGALACFVKEKKSNHFRIRILWAPPLYPLDGIIKSMGTYCDDIQLDFEKAHFENGEDIITNIVSGSVSLQKGMSLQQLPYVIKLVNTANRYVLLVIQERPPICLRCRCVGHIRRQCKMFRCTKCLLNHSREDKCPIKSYATIIGAPPDVSLPLPVSCNSPPAKGRTDHTLGLVNTDVLESNSSLKVGGGKLMNLADGLQKSDIILKQVSDLDVLDGAGAGVAGRPELGMQAENIPIPWSNDDIGAGDSGGFTPVSSRITRSFSKRVTGNGVNQSTRLPLPVPQHSDFRVLNDEMDDQLGDEDGTTHDLLGSKDGADGGVGHLDVMLTVDDKKVLESSVLVVGPSTTDNFCIKRAKMDINVGTEDDHKLDVSHPVPSKCAYCGNAAHCHCSRCFSERYCGRDCQVKHWEIHKVVCRLTVPTQKTHS